MFNTNSINSRNGRQYEMYYEDGRFEVREIVSDAQVIVCALAYAILTCYLVPAYIPYIILWGTLMSSVYAMACIIRNSRG